MIDDMRRSWRKAAPRVFVMFLVLLLERLRSG